MSESRGEKLFIDVRPQDSEGNPAVGEPIPGAIPILLSDIESGAYHERLSENQENVEYIIFCVRGIRAAIATELFVKDGYSATNGGSAANIAERPDYVLAQTA